MVSTAALKREGLRFWAFVKGVHVLPVYAGFSLGTGHILKHVLVDFRLKNAANCECAAGIGRHSIKQVALLMGG